MKFEYTPPQTTLEEMLGGHRCVNAIGPIHSGDDVRFSEFLRSADVPPRTDIYINSSGGDVDAAIGIGRITRDGWHATHVGSYLIDDLNDDGLVHLRPRKFLDGDCLSAATLIYLGGRLRYLSKGARFGVHQFSFKSPLADSLGRSQILSAKIARYIEDMGISSEFLEVSASVESAAINLVAHDRLRSLSIVTDGITEVDWNIQAGNSTIYVRGERDTLWGHQKLIIGFVRPHFFVHAVIESQGRAEHLRNFPLVELVIGLKEDRVIDISGRCSREQVNVYTNIVARITAEEAQSLASSDGFGLRVRGGAESGVFLGIAPMPTAGGDDLLRSFVRSLC